jgi:signal transduction histidine kinase
MSSSDVLDFSKLQQPDAESKARSEPINIRDLAKGIAKGCSTPHFRRASADKLLDMDKTSPSGIIESGSGRSAGSPPLVEVILDIESDVPDIVWGDKVYLTRVIMNLIK